MNFTSDLIGARKPRGFYGSAENVKDWYLFLCKKLNNNNPLSHQQLIGEKEGSTAVMFGRLNISKKEIDKKYFGKPLQQEWGSRDEVILFYKKEAIKNGGPITSKDFPSGLQSAMHNRKINKKDLDFQIFGKSRQFDWDKELKKDPNFILNFFKNIYSKYGRSLSRNELIDYCCNNNIPFSGRALLCAMNRNQIKKSELDLSLGYSPPSSYIVTLNNGQEIIVKSSAEVKIANMLSNYKLNFDYDNFITKSHNYKYDFLVNDQFGNPVYIEFFGYNVPRLQNNPTYSKIESEYLKKQKIKTDLYQSHGKKLISIDGDFFNKADVNHQFEFYLLLKDYNVYTREYKELSLENLCKSIHGFKWDLKKVSYEYKNLCNTQNNGFLISESELLRMDRSDIVNAVRQHHPSRSVLQLAKDLGIKDNRVNMGKTGRPKKTLTKKIFGAK